MSLEKHYVEKDLVTGKDYVPIDGGTDVSGKADKVGSGHSGTVATYNTAGNLKTTTVQVNDLLTRAHLRSYSSAMATRYFRDNATYSAIYAVSDYAAADYELLAITPKVSLDGGATWKYGTFIHEITIQGESAAIETQMEAFADLTTNSSGRLQVGLYLRILGDTLIEAAKSVTLGQNFKIGVDYIARRKD